MGNRKAGTVLNISKSKKSGIIAIDLSKEELD
jgi:hypothetical protein